MAAGWQGLARILALARWRMTAKKRCVFSHHFVSFAYFTENIFLVRHPLPRQSVLIKAVQGRYLCRIPYTREAGSIKAPR